MSDNVTTSSMLDHCLRSNSVCYPQYVRSNFRGSWISCYTHYNQKAVALHRPHILALWNAFLGVFSVYLILGSISDILPSHICMVFHWKERKENARWSLTVANFPIHLNTPYESCNVFLSCDCCRIFDHIPSKCTLVYCPPAWECLHHEWWYFRPGIESLFYNISNILSDHRASEFHCSISCIWNFRCGRELCDVFSSRWTL